MKRQLAILLIMLSCSIASTQIKTGPYFGYSNFGYIDKSIDGKNIEMVTSSTNIMGWFLEPKIYKKLYLETGLQFSNREFKMHFNTSNYIVSNAYIGIPTILNYYIIHEKTKVFVSGGHQLGFNFKGKFRNTQNESASDLRFGKRGYFDNFNYELVFGGGVGYGRFLVCYRYQRGLQNAIKIEPYDYRSSCHNISLKLNIGKRSNA